MTVCFTDSYDAAKYLFRCFYNFDIHIILLRLIIIFSDKKNKHHFVN